MAYSEEAFEEMKYNPILIRAYFWRVVTHARLDFAKLKNEYPYSGLPKFDDDDPRRWLGIRLKVAEYFDDPEFMDTMVASCLERPLPCAACKELSK